MIRGKVGCYRRRICVVRRSFGRCRAVRSGVIVPLAIASCNYNGPVCVSAQCTPRAFTAARSYCYFTPLGAKIKSRPRRIVTAPARGTVCDAKGAMRSTGCDWSLWCDTHPRQFSTGKHCCILTVRLSLYVRLLFRRHFIRNCVVYTGILDVRRPCR